LLSITEPEFEISYAYKKKHVLQALGWEAKIYDVAQNFKIFIQKNVANFARLQTLKVACKCA